MIRHGAGTGGAIVSNGFTECCGHENSREFRGGVVLPRWQGKQAR
jgi:hypothetical protein